LSLEVGGRKRLGFWTGHFDALIFFFCLGTDAFN
jgi:hypothetical protein